MLKIFRKKTLFSTYDIILINKLNWKDFLSSKDRLSLANAVIICIQYKHQKNKEVAYFNIF